VTDAVAQPAKVDPETLAIRTRPPRAIRFKRGAIIAIAAAASVSVSALTWVALKPRLASHGAEQTELSEPSPPPDESLAKAPATYGDVPRLGPPLPGDLGKPILEHQQGMAAPIEPTDQQQAQGQAAAQQQRLADLKAARESGLLVQHRAAPTPANSTPEPATATLAIAEGQKLVLDPDRDPNAQGHKAEFVARVDPARGINPHSLRPPASPYILSAGSVIAASLITGLRSDLPGSVIAQVTENTFDSPTGRNLLIPQGTRLMGTYDSVVAFGQKRALIVWQRMILPDGSSLDLDNVPASDPSGYAGLEDRVDFHTWQLLKGVLLSTILGVSSDLALSGKSDLVQALRSSTEESAARSGDQMAQHSLGIQPTITIRSGAPVRLIVHRDLLLAPWHGQE
jgi:type IV secretion system protein VirB10